MKIIDNINININITGDVIIPIIFIMIIVYFALKNKDTKNTSKTNI